MPLTRDQVIDRILARVARGGSTDHRDNLVAELNLAQELTLERGYPKPWFILDIATVVVDGSGYRAPLPTTFIELFEEDPAVLLVSPDGKGLTPLEVTGRANVEASLLSPNTASAVSVMEGFLLFASPLPVGASVRILHYRKEPLNTHPYGAVGQPAPNRWLTYAADVLIGHVGVILAGCYLRDKEALEFFRNLEAIAMRRLVAENTAQKQAARQMFLNGALHPSPGEARPLTTLP